MRVFDGHNDVLLRLMGAGPDGVAGFLAGDGAGDVDLPRALAGGFAGGCFAVFTCEPPHDQDRPGPADAERAAAEAREQIALLGRLEADSGGRLRIARAGADLDGDEIAAVLHFEGAEPLGSSVDALDAFHAAGLRSLGLVWSRENAFATGVPFAFPGSPDQGPGLTDLGRALVRACGERGVLVDLAHLNERGFWDVAELGDAPLVVSHACAHAICPSPRNLTDDQLRAVGETGGLVGINFHVGFLREDGAEERATPLALIARHATYVAEVAGVEAVALGSDFDGATMPAGLDVGGLPAVLDALRDAGFDDEQVALVAHGNWRRVLEAAWTR